MSERMNIVSNLNEQEKKVIEQYTGYPEGKRLLSNKANETEFIVTMHYLHKYLKPGAPVFIAFCLQNAPLLHAVFMSEDPAGELTTVGYDRDKALVTDNTDSS